MNREKFIEYLDNPGELDGSHIDDIRGVLQEYPYFQTAHMLLVKALNNIEDLKFANQLKISAAHIGNRHILFNLVHQHQFTIKADKEPAVSTGKGDQMHSGGEEIVEKPESTGKSFVVEPKSEEEHRETESEKREPATFDAEDDQITVKETKSEQHDKNEEETRRSTDTESSTEDPSTGTAITPETVESRFPVTGEPGIEVSGSTQEDVGGRGIEESLADRILKEIEQYKRSRDTKNQPSAEDEAEAGFIPSDTSDFYSETAGKNDESYSEPEEKSEDNLPEVFLIDESAEIAGVKDAQDIDISGEADRENKEHTDDDAGTELLELDKSGHSSDGESKDQETLPADHNEK